MKQTSIFYVNSSQGTGQFARLESASNALKKEHNVIWVSPKVKNPIEGIEYKNTFKEIKFNKDAKVNIIFSSESDIIKNYITLILFKINYKNSKIIFMQRIDSLKNYLFNFKKNPSFEIFIRIVIFPFFIFLGLLLIDKYIFQTPFALRDYFLKKRIRTLFMCLFFNKQRMYTLTNNSGTQWNLKFKNNNESFMNSSESLKRTIVYIGNIQFYGKGIDTIIKASKKLDASKYSFKLIGSIPHQFKEKIEDIKVYVSRNDLDIEFCGHRENPHLYLKNKNTIFVSASRLDLSPNSVLEALSFKIPILLSDISAHQFIFRSDEFLFGKDNFDELSIKIAALFENEDHWERNLNFVEQVYEKFNFDWDSEFFKIINV
tara:strand:+ start:446 stop:1567 length:1122 start_codon:yes stop_codon:yes gene_type:complete